LDKCPTIPTHATVASDNPFFIPIVEGGAAMTEFKFIRKIVRMGYSKYINLPKDWLKSNRLKDDDEIELVLAENGDLILRKIKKKTNSSN